jgi:1-acyl-sn-glycerol-3-phosphate acyltransferase
LYREGASRGVDTPHAASLFWLLVVRLYRVIAAVFTIAFYAVMGPFGYAGFAALSLAPTRDPNRRARRLQWVMRTAFTLMNRWLSLVRIRVSDPTTIRNQMPQGAFVVIANHPALDDGLSIMSGVPHVCTAINHTTFARWWLRPLLAGAGQFCGRAPNLLGGGEVLEAAIKRLQDGFRVLVFPEGHRSFRGGLRPFARGAFEIACKTGVPVVPILIRADPLWLARGDSVFVPTKDLAKKTLEVLEPLHPGDFGGDSRQMRDYAESMYRRLLGLSPEGDAPQPRSMTT